MTEGVFRDALGALMVATPFAVLFALMVRASGWRVALVSWGLGALMCGMVLGGSYLLFG